MSTNVGRSFSAIGGCPALDLVNTQPMGEAGPEERLADFAALNAWAEQMALISRATARRLEQRSGAVRALADARALREALRAALQAQHSGRPAWGKLRTLLNAALAAHPGVQKLRASPDGFALTVEREITTPGDLVGLIAEHIASFVASADRDMARPCEGRACVLWFIDRTRNHSRHWCRMESCGARAKARAYYQRAKARR